MCDKCQPHSKYWTHLADDWTEEEQIEMFNYLFEHYIGKVKT
jgi:hypothetical protein